MLIGHLAVALGAKAAEPKLPLAAAVGASFALDLLWPLLLLGGAEVVRAHPGDTAFTNLEFVSYPWSHSLATVLVWALAAAVVSARWTGTARVGAWIGALVASHWVLDFLMHRPDLPLWPGGPKAGLGLWNSIPASIAVEGGLALVFVAVYLRATRARDRAGRWSLAGLLAFMGLLWITQPWSPPPPSATAIALGSLLMYLLLPWAAWIERHRAGRRTSGTP